MSARLQIVRQQVPGRPSPALTLLGVLAWLLFLTTLVSGCVSRPNLARQYFSLSVPSLNSTPANGHSRVLEIRRLVVAAPFANGTLIYRTGDFSYEPDHYAQFLVPPAEDFLAPLSGYFRGFGIARVVTAPGSALAPNVFAEITIDELYGDFRDRHQPAAVLTMGFTFLGTSSGLPGHVLLQKHYHERVRLQARTAAGVVAGWNKALQQILAAVKIDLGTNAAGEKFSRRR